LKDVEESEDNASGVDENEEEYRGVSEEEVGRGHAKVENEDGGFGGHQDRVVADRKDIFCSFEW
jgi:hypothetical protein